MKTKSNTLTTTHRRATTEELITAHKLATQNPYERPQKAVYCVLRAKIRDSGLKMYIDLQNSFRADQQTANEWQTLVDLEQAEQTAKTLAKTLANLEKTAKDITATDEDRTTALKQHQEQSRELAKIKSTITALNDILDNSSTFTDRQDLLQVAYIQDLTNRTEPAPITIEHLALVGKTEEDTSTLTVDEWATLQSKANFSAICKAVNRYMDTLPQAQTMDRVKKKYIPQTQAQANEWANIYGGIGKEIKVHQPRKKTRNSECFATMEYHDTKTRKGFYKVMHYLTTAPITYIEQYTNEEGKNTLDTLIKYRAESHEPTAQNISTADTHKAILQEIARLKKDELTKRQAEFLSTFTSRQVEEYGDRAKQYYTDHKQGTQTTAQAEKWAYKKRIEKTFSIMGITNRKTKEKTLYRLSQAIKPRATAPSINQEPTPIIIPSNYKTTAEHEYNHTPQTIADIVKWHTDTTSTEKAIQWQTTDKQYHTISAEERRAEEQAERDSQALRLIYSARLETFKMLRDADQWHDMTKQEHYNAKYSAFIFFNAMTEQEQLKATELRLYEQSQAKAKAERMKKEKSISLEEWHKMSRAEKDRYILEFQKKYA